MSCLTTTSILKLIFIVVAIVSLMIYLFNKKEKDYYKIYKVISIIILTNLLLSVFYPTYSLLYLLSIDSISSTADRWAIRGQIGDILSGHFTALAFIGLLFSLEKQSKSIAQNKELIGQQKKEMETSNIYKKIEFYYGQLDELKRNTIYYEENNKRIDFNKLMTEITAGKNCFISNRDLRRILDFYQFIYNEIEKIQDEHKELYEDLTIFYKFYIASIDSKSLNKLLLKGKIYSEMGDIELTEMYSKVPGAYTNIKSISITKEKLDDWRIVNQTKVYEGLEILVNKNEEINIINEYFFLDKDC